MRKWLVVSSAVLLAAAARGQVKVMDSEDVVKLVSGEEMRGKVLASGLRAVVIVVKGEEEDALVEKTIPREQIVTIARGDFCPTMKSYATDTVEGVKVVTGESEGGEEAPGLGEAAGPAPKGPPKGAGKAAPKGGGGRVAPEISRQQLEKLMQTNPAIERMVAAAGGPDKAMSLLKQQGNNPQFARFLQQFLKTGKLPPGLPLGALPRK